MEEATALKDLGIPCIVNVFGRLTPKECAQAACVSVLWCEVAAEEVLWRNHVWQDFAATQPCLPDGTAAASFKYVSRAKS